MDYLSQYKDPEEDEDDNEKKQKDLSKKRISNDENLNKFPNKKIKSDDDLVLPSFFDEPKDDEEKKNNDSSISRIRSYPHMKGNWPTHVYIEVNIDKNDKTFNACKEYLMNKFSNINDIKWNEIDPSALHISLSRAFPLRHHEIDVFWEKLDDLLTEHSSSIPSLIPIELNEYELYVNDEKTTSFIGMNVIGKSKDIICSLIKIVDKVMDMFGHPVYYENPSPHISIAWALGNIKSSIKKEDVTGKLPCTILLNSNKIVCKIGKYIHTHKIG